MKPYKKTLMEMLENPRTAAEYINAILEEGDPKMLLVALRDVAEARGGLRKVARQTRLHRGNLYKILSAKGNPEIGTLVSLLDLFGMRLAVAPKDSGSEHPPLKKAA